MAVGAFTYGTVAKVEALVGDVAASRLFAVGTAPTLAQVEAMLDDTASQVHTALAEGGYAIKNKTDLTTAAPRAVDWLSLLNSLGAAALVLQSVPAEAQVADLPEAPPSRGNWFQRRFEDGLKRVATTNFLAVMGLARTGVLDKVYAGSQKDADGNVKKPLFTRGMTDYPGSRSLTE